MPLSDHTKTVPHAFERVTRLGADGTARRLADPPLAERAARLRHTPIFAGLSPAALRALAAEVLTFETEPDATIIHQGDRGTALYIVVKGFVRVLRRDSAGIESVLGELHKGEFFGEMALLAGQTRSASIVARNAVTLMRLDGQDFRRVIAQYPQLDAQVRRLLEQRRDQFVERRKPPLRQRLARLSALLGGLPEELLRDLRAELDWMWFPADATVVEAGEPGDCMYVVSEGHLSAHVPQPGGEALRVGEVGVGETVGEEALITDKPRSATVRAEVDSALLRLGRADFEALAARQPELAARLSRLVIRRRAFRAGASTPLPRARHPTQADVDAVILTEDPILRNHRITLMYHRLGSSLAGLLGRDDVNWPLFGCRASLTAGSSIRGEDMQQLAAPFRVGPLRWLRVGVAALVARTRLRRAVQATLDTVAAAIAAGNLRIFAEVGGFLARFVTLFADDQAFDRDKLDAFVAGLVPGPVELGGQALLAGAASAWYEAAFEKDPKLKSEKVMLGNCLIGLHEQTRVQPDIVEALEAPLRLHLGDELGTWLFGRSALRHLPGSDWLRRRTVQAEQALTRAIGRRIRRTITRRMMRLRLVDREVRLGQAVPRFQARGSWPEALREPGHPPLVELLERYRIADAPDRGAIDWARLDDRMRFIITLFRASAKQTQSFFPPPQGVQTTHGRGVGDDG
ncbi:MAG: cyclic nucleotide-binding domain-containing protein [Myxococcales bacterium]|jgi:CRP-like cAMP-binding protein